MAAIADILDDYSNLTPLSGEPGLSCFEAIQTGTNRTVILEVLDRQEQTPEVAALFLEMAKIKASIDYPHVYSVLEAGERDGILFLAREKPARISLRQLKDEGKQLTSGDLLQVLSIISSTLPYFEQRGINTIPADISQIYMGESGITLANLAIPGPRRNDAEQEDMRLLGTQLSALISTGSPGATRLTTICKLMTDGHLGTPVEWSQINELVQTVLEQMGQNKGNSTKIVVARMPGKSSNWIKIIGISLIVCILAGISTALLSEKKKDTPLPPVKHNAPAFLNRDHTFIPVATGLPQGKIACDAHEVTIGAYSRFLESLDNMPASGSKKFDQADQPKTKKNHLPDDWANMLSAAKTNSTWQGRPLSMRSPVVNIDFWDAAAYANWKGHRLPTREEWTAIAGKLHLNGTGDSPCPVDKYDNDVDASGLCGFSSGVKEWTSSIERDISRPVDPPKRVSCGGTSSSPGLNKIHYEPSSEERSPELGFRTIRN